MEVSKNRASKRLKSVLEIKDKNEDQSRESSYLFSPFRTIGYVSNHVPFDVMIRGTSFLVSTCVGRNIQTYDVKCFIFEKIRMNILVC